MEKMNKKLREELSSLNERKAVDEKVIVTSTQAGVSMCLYIHVYLVYMLSLIHI